jgi:type VI secretion system secreted protein VgrG
MPYTQENRLIAIDTPLGKDVLLLQGFTGHEAISRLFSFHLDLLSEKNSISFEDIVGQKVSIRVTLFDGSERYFHGQVSRFAQSGADLRFTHYQMEVVPWLWFLTRNADCKIFQNMTIPDIIQKVFKDRSFQDFKVSLTGSYQPREYCVQYRETDFNFVSRLMEQYGIFYFFQHEKSKHTLVLGDSPSVFQACPGQSKVRYDLATGAMDTSDVINGWHMEQELRTGKYSLNDYNFETPSTSLLAGEPTVDSVGGNTAYELYDYPGEYLNQSQGSALSKLRMQEEEASHLVINGSGLCRAFTSGYTFEIDEHYRSDMNGTYLLTEVQHVASVGGSYSLGTGGSGESYSNHFTCIQSKVPFRPARITPKPFVQGPQTALVVGKKDEEIWVDKYGRIKVQFYWDRVGKKNENSSCWIRVSQPWAGKNWGSIWIPRMGQEVIVSFLEGDPDRPIITGRVYNAEQEVPYTLPDHQTVSTFLSRSSKGGGSANFNELRFEDKKGSEQIFINAEKDMDLRVENDSREFVGNNRSLIVTQDQMESVGGDQHIQVTGNRNEKIGQNMSLQIGQNLYEKSGQNYAHEAGQEIHLKAGMDVVIEAGMQLTIQASGNFINIGPAGIAISGTMVLINSGGAAGSGSPSSPQDPTAPDKADDGSKFTKL